MTHQLTHPHGGQLRGKDPGVGDAVQHQDPGPGRLVRGEPALGDEGGPHQTRGVGHRGPALPVEVGRHPGDTLAPHHHLAVSSGYEDNMTSADVTCSERVPGQW